MPYVPSHKTPGLEDDRVILDKGIKALTAAIGEVSARHKYEASFAGELNYSLTRLIQEIPRELVERGILTEELRYWIQPLLYGVLLDVALEHKARVNQAYEAAQIVKSGDCYDTTYFSKLVEVVDSDGNLIGHQHVLVKNDGENVKQDVLNWKIIACVGQPHVG